jgi:hypothetical protein
MADENISPEITPLGLYNFRNQRKKFGIKVNDRRRHIYIVGKTGVGKTTLLKNMMIADIQAGRGVGVLDPHGEFAESLLDYIPEGRIDDVIYFDPSDLAYPIAFNPMEQVTTEFRHLVASGIMSVFKKIWVDAWSARMEYILNNTLLALLELPDTTLMDVMRMFADKEFRKKIVESLQDPVIKAFWRDEFANYGQRLESEALASIQNKVGQLVSNPLIRNIMGQPRSTLNMRDIMDSGKILIVNLSKGKIGEDNSALLGAMIITRLQLAAMSRVDIQNEDDRRDFFLYVDEFQNFATDSFASILSEARKYRLSLVLAHQYIGQLTAGENTNVRDAIFGNVGTIISFRVGATDAEFLEKEFMPQFTQTDLVNLAFASIYIRLMIDGLASQPFSAETLPPTQSLLVSYKDVIIANSRRHYGTPRAVVEKKISGAWEGASSVGITEKIERRDERRLSDVLRPGPAHTPQKRSFVPPSVVPTPKAPPVIPPTKPSENDPMAEEFIKSRGSRPHDLPGKSEKAKIFIKPDVDISELRRGINDSLAKPFEEKSGDRAEELGSVKNTTELKPVESRIVEAGISRDDGKEKRVLPVVPVRPENHLESGMRGKPKEFPRPTVNIDDLRNSVRNSLKNQLGDAQKKAPSSSSETLHSDGMKKPIILSMDEAFEEKLSKPEISGADSESAKGNLPENPIGLPEKASAPNDPGNTQS